MSKKFLSRRLLMTIACAVALSLAACGEKKENDEKATGAASTPETIATPTANTTISAVQGGKKVGLHKKHKPSAATIAKVKAPKPPANAKKLTTIGKGRLAIKRANQGYVWTEEVDVEDDGTVETTDYYYDPVDKITYLYVQKAYTCADPASRGSDGMLIAVYGEGNKWRKPAGSGWYLTELDAGQCNSQTVAVWGCKLNASGETTECGFAASQVDDIVIIEATTGGGGSGPGATPGK